MPEHADVNLYTVSEEKRAGYEKLPQSLEEAADCAKNSGFVKRYVPQAIAKMFF